MNVVMFEDVWESSWSSETVLSEELTWVSQ